MNLQPVPGLCLALLTLYPDSMLPRSTQETPAIQFGFSKSSCSEPCGGGRRLVPWNKCVQHQSVHLSLGGTLLFPTSFVYIYILYVSTTNAFSTKSFRKDHGLHFPNTQMSQMDPNGISPATLKCMGQLQTWHPNTIAQADYVPLCYSKLLSSLDKTFLNSFRR